MTENTVWVLVTEDELGAFDSFRLSEDHQLLAIGYRREMYLDEACEPGVSKAGRAGFWLSILALGLVGGEGGGYVKDGRVRKRVKCERAARFLAKHRPLL